MRFVLLLDSPTLDILLCRLVAVTIPELGSTTVNSSSIEVCSSKASSMFSWFCIYQKVHADLLGSFLHPKLTCDCHEISVSWKFCCCRVSEFVSNFSQQTHLVRRTIWCIQGIMENSLTRSEGMCFDILLLDSEPSLDMILIRPGSIAAAMLLLCSTNISLTKIRSGFCSLTFSALFCIPKRSHCDQARLLHSKQWVPISSESIWCTVNSPEANICSREV